VHIGSKKSLSGKLHQGRKNHERHP
jgi:hypothetical protein